MNEWMNDYATSHPAGPVSYMTLRPPLPLASWLALLAASAAADMPSPATCRCGGPQWPRIFILGAQKAGSTSVRVWLWQKARGPTGSIGFATADCCANSSCPCGAYGYGESHFLTTCAWERDTFTYYQEDQHKDPRQGGMWKSTPCRNYAQSFIDDGFTKLDSTPEMLSCPRVPHILAAFTPLPLQPTMHFIAILREQSSRLLSVYNHNRVNFAQALVFSNLVPKLVMQPGASLAKRELAHSDDRSACPLATPSC